MLTLTDESRIVCQYGCNTSKLFVDSSFVHKGKLACSTVFSLHQHYVNLGKFIKNLPQRVDFALLYFVSTFQMYSYISLPSKRSAWWCKIIDWFVVSKSERTYLGILPCFRIQHLSEDWSETLTQRHHTVPFLSSHKKTSLFSWSAVVCCHKLSRGKKRNDLFVLLSINQSAELREIGSEVFLGSVSF